MSPHPENATIAPHRASLDREAWIDFALQVLPEEGVDGLRIEVLARRLNVTKGSFYWHFKDRQALLNALITHWRDERIREVESQASIPPDMANDQIRLVLDQYVTHPNQARMRTELAIREWARRDTLVATAVEAVDQARLANATNLFKLAGYPENTAQAHALLLFTHIFGLSMMMFEDSISARIAQHCSTIADLIASRQN
jgi:AcrR family transcriptional regulator